MPFFSLIVPAMGRPAYTRDTVKSILLQNFDDFEIIFSNNGGSPEVKDAVADFMEDPRFHYLEQPKVINMPSHWDLLVQKAKGDYILLRPNRRILKQGALSKLQNLIFREQESVDLISWRGDSYDSITNTLRVLADSEQEVLRYTTTEVLQEFALGKISLGKRAYILPLAMNTCVSRALLNRIRDREFCVFQPINPDYRFAFSSLLNTAHLIHMTDRLEIGVGLEVSNGVNAVRGDAATYIESLGQSNPWQDVPIKAALIYNGVAQDFLKALRVYDRPDIKELWDWKNYYWNCVSELKIKKKSCQMSKPRLKRLEAAITFALQKENRETQNYIYRSFFKKVMRRMGLAVNSLFNPLTIKSKKSITGGPEHYKIKHCQSLWVAAGFELE